MLVYRIEDANGRGAWRAGLSYLHDSAVHGDKRVKRTAGDMPSPFDEPGHTPVHQKAMGEGFKDYQVFAFASPTQLRRAFRSKRGRAAMKAAQGLLNIYEVPASAVLKGTAQVVFDRRKAKRVGSLDLVTLKKPTL